MHHHHVFASGLLFFSLACGGSEKPLVEPTPPVPAESAASGHLNIVPFVMTTSGVKSDGTPKADRVIRGNADGVISIEENGVSKEVFSIASNGTFTRLDSEGEGESLRIDKSGTFHINGVPFTEMRIGEDGTMYGGDEVFLRIENGKVIDVTGKFLKSSFSFNGNTQTTTYEIVIEGGPEAQQLAGVMLGLMLMPGKESKQEAESSPQPTVAPEPVAPNPAP